MPDDPDDLDLHPLPPDAEEPELPLPDPTPEARDPATALWIALTGGIVLVAALAFWVLRPRPAAVAPAPLPAAKVAPLTPPPTLLPLPPLEGSDSLVRELARALSPHPVFALWLAQAELARMLTAVVLNVAEGESPRAHLAFLAPKAAFSANERRSGRLTVDPASYSRYDPVGDAVASLDPAECARVYRLLEPLFESAYRELGHPEGGFSGKLGAAFAKLLEVPVLEGEVPLVRVEKAVVLYEFFDEKVEALSIPQKHLLRMGPRNVRRIQDKVRAMADALGLPVPLAAGPPGHLR